MKKNESSGIADKLEACVSATHAIIAPRIKQCRAPATLISTHRTSVFAGLFIIFILATTKKRAPVTGRRKGGFRAASLWATPSGLTAFNYLPW
ncbi:MAG: hypothetical protein ACFCUG_01340 [Thiotrichales bacterium]